MQDIDQHHFLLRVAPTVLKPFLLLMRVDRPQGTWLLLFPCLYGLALGILSSDAAFPISRLCLLIIVFAVGAFLMRSAGCVWNDLQDMDFDARVERTKNRPLASQSLSRSQAFLLLFLLLSFSAGLLVFFDSFSQILAVGSLVLVAAYPFAKRITNWPQIVLGLTFNWGVLLGYSAVTHSMSVSAVLVYLGCSFWTLGYDTLYALQDRRDDRHVGIGSSALALGAHVVRGVSWFYVLAVGLISVGFFLVFIPDLQRLSALSIAFSSVGLIWFSWQLWTQIDRLQGYDFSDDTSFAPQLGGCLFRTNILAGALLSLGLLSAALLHLIL